jgi:hypothetical protein
MIRMSDTKVVAGELHSRFDPARAVVLIGRSLQRALFAGRSEDVVFWALVHAHYRGGDLCDAAEEQLAAFSRFILRDRSERN